MTALKQIQRNDYDVLHGREIVGRIYRSAAPVKCFGAG